MLTHSAQIQSDQWMPSTWDNFLKLGEDPKYTHAKGYFYHDHARLEMLPIGFDHSKDHGTLALAVNLLLIFQQIPYTVLDNCSFRQPQVCECQPDLAYYLGDDATAIPHGTNVVNLDRYPCPSLVIEISKTTLIDDLGAKRLLYESLGIAEYWVLDMDRAKLIAYQICDRGSHQIDISQVLPDLPISVLEEALQKSRSADQSQVGAWLMNQFQSNP